jgi:hypothetical protein
MVTDSPEVRSEKLKSVLRQVAREARRRILSNYSGLAEVVPVSAAVWIQDRADWRIPDLLYEEMWHCGRTGFQTKVRGEETSRGRQILIWNATPGQNGVRAPVRRKFRGSGNPCGRRRRLRGRNGCGQKWVAASDG